MNNYITKDKIAASKVPFKGFRGVLLFALVLLVSPVFGQQYSDISEREPFSPPTLFSANDQLNRAPGGPGIILPPPTEEEKVGGAPVEDAIWLLPLLALGYGIFKRKLITKSSKIEILTQ